MGVLELVDVEAAQREHELGSDLAMWGRVRLGHRRTPGCDDKVHLLSLNTTAC
jgi:hypothetical protein